MIEDVDGAVETGYPLFNFLRQNAFFGVLAAQAQHRRPGYVGMRDVARNQAAQGLSILPGTAATRLVGDEFDPVHVRKNGRNRFSFRRGGKFRL